MSMQTVMAADLAALWTTETFLIRVQKIIN